MNVQTARQDQYPAADCERLRSAVISQLVARTEFLLAEADKQKISNTRGETDLPMPRCPASGKDQIDVAET
jgi:hypothetical protein